MLAEHIGTLAIIFVCILLSAFFSSSEAAFLSMKRTARLTHLVNTGATDAARVAAMLEQPSRLLSTILLGNNLVNVAFTALVTIIFVDMFTEGLGVIMATVVGTAALLILGESIPKTLAVRHSERLAFLYARPLQWMETALIPLVLPLQWISRVSDIGEDEDEPETSITEEELRSLIDIGGAEGAFKPEEAEMLESVFRFGDGEVREVMTPRTEVIFIERGTTLGELLDTYSEHSHTRFPVFKENMDNIVGIISAKDILKTMSTRPIGHEESVTDVIRDAYFVPDTKRIAELFDELRRSGNQMAIVVDEYGGVAGLVTLKSLVEVVVGRVGEEGSSPEEEYEAISENTFQVDGGMSIEEAEEDLNIELPDGDFETVAGFVLSSLGHIPIAGEHLEYNNLKLEVTEMNNLKIETIKLTIMPVHQQDQETNENT